MGSRISKSLCTVKQTRLGWFVISADTSKSGKKAAARDSLAQANKLPTNPVNISTSSLTPRKQHVRDGYTRDSGKRSPSFYCAQQRKLCHPLHFHPALSHSPSHLLRTDRQIRAHVGQVKGKAGFCSPSWSLFHIQETLGKKSQRQQMSSVLDC